MNDSATSASSSSLLPDTTSAFTAAHLVVIAIFALLVIAGLVWGARLKRQRKAAEREIIARNDDATPAPPPGEPAAVETSPGTASTRPATPQAAAPPPPAAQPTPVRSTTPDADSARPLADEPIAASAPLDAAPQQEAASAPTDSGVADPADLPVTQLKGLGPKVAARLAELGITHVGQLAAMSDDQAEALDAELGTFRGRMARDRWIEQARLLASGDVKGFEAAFGRL